MPFNPLTLTHSTASSRQRAEAYGPRTLSPAWGGRKGRDLFCLLTFTKIFNAFANLTWIVMQWGRIRMRCVSSWSGAQTTLKCWLMSMLPDSSWTAGWHWLSHNSLKQGSEPSICTCNTQHIFSLSHSIHLPSVQVSPLLHYYCCSVFTVTR